MDVKRLYSFLAYYNLFILVSHETAMHDGETCDEYDRRCKAQDQSSQEAASLATIRKLSKKCPGPECVYSIEKKNGCDHMTCTLQAVEGEDSILTSM